MDLIPIHQDPAQENDPLNEEETSPFASLTPVCFFLICENLSFSDLLTCAKVNQYWREEVIAYCARIRTLELVTKYKMFPTEELEMAAFAHLLTNEDGSRIYPNAGLKEKYSIEFNNNDPQNEGKLPLAIEQLPLGLNNSHGFGRFCPSLCDTLKSYFLAAANVQMITFHHFSLTVEKVIGLCSLLGHFKSTLITFKLSIHSICLSTHKNHLLTKLFTLINKLTRLERLTLHFTGDRIDFKPKLLVLSWLHEFNFFTKNDTEDLLYSSLINYAATNLRLNRITYQANSVINSQADVHAALIRYTTNVKLIDQSAITSRFTHLPFSHKITRESLELLPSPLVRFFPSITTLHFELPFANLSPTIIIISNLPQLNNIEMLLHCPTPFDHPLPSASELIRLPRLRSVFTLKLQTFYTDHANIANFSLPYFFPNLQAFKIIFRGRSTINTCCRCQGMDVRAIEDGRRFGRNSTRALPENEQEAAFQRCSRGIFMPWKDSLKFAQINSRSLTTID